MFSPSEKIVDSLLLRGASVRVDDPFSCESYGAIHAKSVEDCLADSDCVVIITNHAAFEDHDLRRARCLMSVSPVIIDAVRMSDRGIVSRAGFIYLGVGFSGETSVQPSV